MHNTRHAFLVAYLTEPHSSASGVVKRTRERETREASNTQKAKSSGEPGRLETTFLIFLPQFKKSKKNITRNEK